jgi:hypothetical protein
MKKIPTLFTRVFENHKIVDITPDITPGCEEAFLNGCATVKIDGACCAVINGKFYKRYDAKKGKKPPKGAIPCCDPDPVTGHHPHWVTVDLDNPDDKWFAKALLHYMESSEANNEVKDGTYEAVGRHFNGNPYDLSNDILIPHGEDEVDVGRDFDSIKLWLNNHKEEGLVFWLNGEPGGKIKRTDFGLKWPVTYEEEE